jgi:hypothetical protein
LLCVAAFAAGFIAHCWRWWTYSNSRWIILLPTCLTVIGTLKFPALVELFAAYQYPKGNYELEAAVYHDDFGFTFCFF